MTEGVAVAEPVALPDTTEQGPGLAFQRGYLRRVGVPAHRALVLDVIDDSMAPSICLGDTVLVDTTQRAPVLGRIYAVVIERRMALRRYVQVSEVDAAFVDGADRQVNGRCQVVGRVVNRSGVI